MSTDIVSKSTDRTISFLIGTLNDTNHCKVIVY